ncbi:hypothetical protein KW787_00115 [Candidatus Pacearchaeota archaeon]|nr:hypothetical protein [Candidatus Pacearchaeota archaeon]
MNLQKKKALTARTMNVGESRVTFNIGRLDEIKEAITKQDIRDLIASKAITIRPIKGRRAVVKRKSRRGLGKVRRRPGARKQEYVKLTRKLRGYLAQAKAKGKLPLDKYYILRKEIRARAFRDLAHMKERMETI